MRAFLTFVLWICTILTGVSVLIAVPVFVIENVKFSVSAANFFASITLLTLLIVVHGSLDLLIKKYTK